MNKDISKNYFLIALFLSIVAFCIRITFLNIDKILENVAVTQFFNILKNSQIKSKEKTKNDQTEKAKTITKIVINPENFSQFPKLTETKYWDSVFYEDSNVDSTGRVILTKRAQVVQKKVNGDQTSLSVTMTDGQKIDVIVYNDTKVLLPKLIIDTNTNEIKSIGAQEATCHHP